MKKDSNKKIADLRTDYNKGYDSLVPMRENPYDVFQQLFDLALEKETPEPNAMTLATVDKYGMPSARIVLLKGFDERGFKFYTNYTSKKGRDMDENPNVALVFCWLNLETQIRIEGTVSKMSEKESNTYFQMRPRKSQIGAWASPQSTSISNSDILKNNFEKFALKFEGAEEVPKPEHWGGYIVAPKNIEFWFGKRSRLHYRRKYQLHEKGNWTNEILAP